ncbi:hypothetical protein LCGC14_2234410 [marine sediment metagenome]|uniref:Uncharacterized protein n=1 Tax=marine sediment metagenome TaxID=412755 RepID=A0A0F9D7H8_9ZZZZ
MWAIQIVGSLNKVLTQFKNTWGYALSVLNYRQVHGQWQAVSWSAGQVAKTALITPTDKGSVEITDLIISTDKQNGATVMLTFEDGTNAETIVNGILTDGPLQINHPVSGRFQGWRNAILYYTVAGANSTGAITVGYVKHGAGARETEDYSAWNSRR